jgi:tRNA(Arg) A34 adenosine deaminase TadA
MCMANALWAGLDRVVYGATIADASRYCLQIRIPARHIARHADMACEVEGPVLRKLCVTLFTHPRMQQAFRTWSSSRSKR